MSDPIRCQFRWTLDEFCAADEQHRRHARGVRQVLIIIWSIVCICLFAGIVRLFTIGLNRTSFMLLVFGSVLATFRFRMFGRGVQARKFANLPDHDKDVRYEIYPDRLIIETSTQKTEIAWSRITNIVRTENGFLMYSQPWMFYWLPLHCLTDSADIERLEQLIANREPV